MNNMNNSLAPNVCEICAQSVRFIATEVRGRRVADTHRFCEAHYVEFEKVHRANCSLQPFAGGLIELDPRMIVMDLLRNEGSFWLYSDEPRHYLGITSGICEVTALHHLVTHQNTARPLTFQATARILEALGGKLRDVVIDEWIASSNTYHAKLRIEHLGQEILIDVRPSDAVNLAVACNAAVYVDSSILKAMRFDAGTSSDT